jgi:hypothetical protein
LQPAASRFRLPAGSLQCSARSSQQASLRPPSRHWTQTRTCIARRRGSITGYVNCHAQKREAVRCDSPESRGGICPGNLRCQSVAFSSGGRLSTALAHSVAALKGEKPLTNGGESTYRSQSKHMDLPIRE